MGDGRDPKEDESWTQMETAQPDLVELEPVRHGMVLGGRYAIEKIIGRGGAGVVVRAHDRVLQAVVAIKIVRAELVGQRMWADRLAREVKLARQIQHAHVCRVFDFQQADGRAFLVMELAERGSLRDEIRSGAAVARPLADRLADARAVASALAAIHDAGIVHRDLTPQNLLRMADGRLVVSDFGLATDAGESTSVHGGTIAYMAPEVVRDGKSTFASDLWALGVVMHEIVFGARPRWRDVASSEMLPPELGRTLTREERRVFEACRACTAKEPGWRPASAGEAGRRLTEGVGLRGWVAAAVGRRRAAVLAAALTVVGAAVAGGLAARREQGITPTATSDMSPLIVPVGEPADWTDVSTVLAEVPDRITCTRLLPDQRTMRFVWGTPPRAEDIDTVTRKRFPSPLVPAAYAEGCPDLSADGRRIVYQGHTKDERAFAFLSQHPDGRDAVPVVPTAEPTMASEPMWLADSETFSFDVDTKRTGVFSVATGRTMVLPDVTSKPYVTSFRTTGGSAVFMATLFDTLEMEVTGLAVPSMHAVTRFRVPEGAIDLHQVGPLFYYASRIPGKRSALIELDAPNVRSRRLARVRDQFVGHPTVLPVGIAFSSTRIRSMVVRGHDGEVRKWSGEGDLVDVARCGADFVASALRDDHMVIVRMDANGRVIETLADGSWTTDPACSPDGRVLFYLQQKGRLGVVRCDQAGCRRIADRQAMSLSVSPDGRHLAIVALGPRGPVVEVSGPNGDRIRELVETETACKPQWASPNTLWVSRRRGMRTVWTEVDVESGRETGKSVSGLRDCADGRPDPQAPGQPEWRVVHNLTAQLRLVGPEYLTRR